MKSPAREGKQLLSDETLGMSVDKEVSLHYIHCVSGFITDCLKSQKIHGDFKKQAEEPGSLQHDIMLQKFLKIVSFVTTNNMGPGHVSTEISHTFLLIIVNWKSLLCKIPVSCSPA